ncbi:MAG: hypothetical protein JO303_17045, partial [Caulobacteraceae bacterium]|nr:hypothetical protein [Caulobacteraceae bacterium]
ARDQINKGKDTATRTLGDFADAIRKAGDELASRDQSTVGKVVKQAADSLEGLSRSVADKRPEELLDALRDFGRNNPVAFVGGSVLLGLAIARFAKSSANRPQPSPAQASINTMPSGGPTVGERRSFASDDADEGARTSSVPYETAGPGVTTPQGSGTGLDSTADFDSAIDANRSRVEGDTLPTGVSGGVQGAQL